MLHAPNQTRRLELLTKAYRSALAEANRHSCNTIAFSALSCGVYGYPINEAAEVAIRSCKGSYGRLKAIYLCLLPGENEIYNTYVSQATEIFSNNGTPPTLSSSM